MMFLPALRSATLPLPPGAFAARFFAAAIRPPLVFFTFDLLSRPLLTRNAALVRKPCSIHARQGKKAKRATQR